MLSAMWVVVLSVPVCDAEDATKCSVAVPQGAVAPFSGQLLTPGLAIDLGLKAQFCDDRIALEVAHARALVQVDLDLERQLRRGDAATAAEIEKVLRREVEEMSTPVYERPWFVATVTTIVVIAAYALAMKSVDWIKVSR